MSPTCNFLFLQCLSTAKQIIVIVPQNMYTFKLFFISFATAVKSYHGPSISKKLTKNSLNVYMVSGDTILKWEMFVWILSHVPSSIALSLFILKSSNLNKINDACYPNLSCGNVRLLIGCNLKLALVPCATSEWPRVLRSFLPSWIYPRVLGRIFMQMCYSCVTVSSI